MEYFTKEELEVLKEAEKHFDTVVKHDYKLYSSIELNNKIADVYDKRTNQKLHRNWACSRCTFNAFNRIGILYYASLQYWKNVDEAEEQKTTEETPTTKKVGRPKKKTTA